jgi:hypothetical protein
MPAMRFCFSSTDETMTPTTWSPIIPASVHALTSCTSSRPSANCLGRASGPLNSGPSAMSSPVTVTTTSATSNATIITAPTGL